MIHRVSRSAIVTRKQCEMRRYLQYELRGTGVSPVSQFGGNLTAVRGQLFHDISFQIIQGAPQREWQESLSRNITSLKLTPQDHALVRRAMLGWQRVRGGWWQEHFDVLSAEAEWSWPITPSIHQPLRMDKILRRKDDKALGIFDYKTMGSVTPNWIEKMLNSDQTHLYIQALKERSGEHVIGMCYDGVIVGKNAKGIQRSPFVTGHQKNGKVSAIWSQGSYPYDLTNYTDDQWMDWILKHDRVLDELYCTTDFLSPQANAMLHTKNSVGRGEEEFKHRVGLIEGIRETYGEQSAEYQQGLNLIEKNSEHCLKFGVGYQCPFVQQCWQGFPVDEQFAPREDHHAQDVEDE
jgi:hypothetical protein